MLRQPARYSWFNDGQVYRLHALERAILKVLPAYGLDALHGKRILEIGCGSGYWLREFVKWGAAPADIAGLDIDHARLVAARGRCHQRTHLSHGSADALPYRNQSFHCILQSTVFTSVLDGSLRQRIAQELLRVLKPGGVILWYDFHVNSPGNPNVRGIGKHDIAALFPQCAIKLRRVTLAPPLSRRLAPCSWFACYGLERLKILNTHYFGVIRPHGTA